MIITYKNFFRLLLSTLLLISFISLASNEHQDMLKAAESGDSEAQYDLALAYDSGDVLDLDHEKAVYWYTQAAEHGYAPAQYNLGVAYQDGEGVEKNTEQAYHWYFKAAAQGYSAAQNNLGYLFEFDEKPDFQQALYWYTKAAKQGNSIAQNNLGLLYFDEDYDGQNYIQAYAWFAVAAHNGNEDARENLKEARAHLDQSSHTKANNLAGQYIANYSN